MPRARKENPSRDELASRILSMRRRRRSLDLELRHLEKLWRTQRPWRHCLRCGYDWQAISLTSTPKCCARCHSKGWDTESSKPRARKPGDAPNPAWERKRAVVLEPKNYGTDISLTVEEIQHPAKPDWDSYVSKIAPDDTPEGLPLPPGMVRAAVRPASAPDLMSRLKAELASLPTLPPPPSLGVPAPMIYLPRPAAAPAPSPEPQPESTYVPLAPASASAPAPESSEPSWESLLPKLDPDLEAECDLHEAEAAS